MGHAGLSRIPDYRALVSVWSQTPWTPRPLPLVQGSEKTFQRPTYELALGPSPLMYLKVTEPHVIPFTAWQ